MLLHEIEFRQIKILGHLVLTFLSQTFYFLKKHCRLFVESISVDCFSNGRDFIRS